MMYIRLLPAVAYFVETMKYINSSIIDFYFFLLFLLIEFLADFLQLLRPIALQTVQTNYKNPFICRLFSFPPPHDRAIGRIIILHIRIGVGVVPAVYYRVFRRLKTSRERRLSVLPPLIATKKRNTRYIAPAKSVSKHRIGVFKISLIVCILCCTVIWRNPSTLYIYIYMVLTFSPTRGPVSCVYSSPLKLSSHYPWRLYIRDNNENEKRR